MKKITLWEKCYYIATFIITVIALISLVYSIRSSNELSKRLEDIVGAAYDVTVPVLKFQSVGLGVATEEFSCKNPINSIFLYVKNYSLTPIQIIDFNYDIVLDDLSIREFQTKPEFEGAEVVPPGEPTNLKIVNTEFTKFFGNPGPRTFVIKVDIYYEKLYSKQKFNLQYETKGSLDCTKPLDIQFTPIKEVISIVSK